jgi:hypothetical protein
MIVFPAARHGPAVKVALWAFEESPLSQGPPDWEALYLGVAEGA